jgi:HSP20 family molecular chaperone IbpA
MNHKEESTMFGIAKQKTDSPQKAGTPDFAPPAVDVYENDDEFLLLADLPGIAQNGAEVTLEHERLVLEAKGATRAFRREFAVPPSIDSDKVSASMKAGVLTVHLPKRAPYKPRQIAVQSS